MQRVWGQHLTVDVHPDPDDDRTVQDISELLLERGARALGDGFFVERRRQMLVHRPTPQHVEIVMSAGPLGDPGHSRRDMVAFARYVTGLLVAVAERTRPLYGGSGVESIFHPPAGLREGLYRQGNVTDPIFVRRDLLARSDLGAVLAGEYRRATEGPAGTVFASWWPFAGGPPAEPDEARLFHEWAGGRLLGRVAARYLLERERAAGTGKAGG